MSMSRTIVCLFTLIAPLTIAACQPSGTEPVFAPTIVPFPTVTPGYEINGVLPARSALESQIANPATAVALAAQPSPTPNTGACPAEGSPTLPTSRPTNDEGIVNTILDYLSGGGAPLALVARMRGSWDIMDTDGFIENIDLTNDGTPEILIGYTTPAERGKLIILGCEEGRYLLRYEAESDEATPPDMLLYQDMNFDSMPEALFTVRVCNPTGESCRYETRVITWSLNLGRFLSLTSGNIISDVQPNINDSDNDEVLEIIIRQEDDGDAQTGPLRTGTNIYDWNGSVYVLAFVQLDPPEYRIQSVYEADRFFREGRYTQALSFYEQVISDASLREWYADDDEILPAYALYRALITRAFIGSTLEQLQAIFDSSFELTDDPLDVPIFVDLSGVFFGEYQRTEDISAACAEALIFIEGQPDVLDLLNRYGDRNPTYTAQDLCPF